MQKVQSPTSRFHVAYAKWNRDAVTLPRLCRRSGSNDAVPALGYTRFDIRPSSFAPAVRAGRMADEYETKAGV
jgi:hypothetical protein